MFDIPDGWAAPEDRLEIALSRTERPIRFLHELTAHRAGIRNEQDAWVFAVDELRANEEASGMPPAIADELGEMLSAGGGMLLSPGEGGFVLLQPDGSGMHFGTTTDDDGHRIMDIAELSADEMADALAQVDYETLLATATRLTRSRDDIDPAALLCDQWAALNEDCGLELADVFGSAIERGIVDAEELQAAVDEAT